MDPRAWAKDLTGYFLFILFTATLGPLLFGFHLAELNAPEDVIRCKKKSIKASANPKLPQCMPMDPAEWGLISSIFTLGGLIGALSAGPVSSRYGRLRCMHLTTIFFVIGPVFEALSPHIGVLAFGRFVSGIGAGAAVVVVPIYISEIAPPAERGFFGAFTQIMCNVGILLAQLLGYFLSHDSMWRIILAAGGVVGLVQAVDEEETLLNNEDRVSQHSNSPKDKNSKESLSMFQVLSHPDTKKATFAVMTVMVAQQFSGINTIIMYGVSLLSTLLAANSALLNLFVSAVNIVVTAGCAPLIERLGRKTCLISSITGMGTSALLLGISIIRVIPILSIIAVVGFVASFGLGLGPVPFILASELVGPEAVGATQSWALAANWVATFVVAQFFPILKAQMGGYVFFIFTVLAVVFGTFVATVVPETKGKKDADEVWGRHPARRED
ncbi:mfs glucose transporter [Neofusicoccum parvum]|nr:mfs glucose transporter [Neofusicoccum parvum]